MSQNMITATRAQPALIRTSLYDLEVEQVISKNVLPPSFLLMFEKQKALRAVSVGLKCDDSVCEGRVS